MDSKALSMPASAWRMAVVGLLAAFCCSVFAALLKETRLSGREDTWSYLAHSVYLAEHGGLPGFLRETFSGRFPIVERHPLYMLLLSPFAERTVWFFFEAKIVNLLIGTLVLGSFIWMLWRRFGPAPALLAAAAYSCSASLVLASSHVCCEPVFVLSTLWTWWWLTGPQTMGRWALGGVCAGLAFLAKSSALLLIIGTLAASLWHSRGRSLAASPLWAFLVATVLTASPLLVRNMRRYGTPIYEGINNAIMWMEHPNDVGQAAFHEDAYGTIIIDRDRFPTATTYLATHNVHSILSRLIRGFQREVRILSQAISTERHLPTPLKVVWGVGALVAGFLVWWRERLTWSGTLFFWWAAAFLTFFAWDAVLWPALRYVAPLIPLVLAYAGRAVWSALVRWRAPAIAARIAWGLSLLILGIAAGRTLASGTFRTAHAVVDLSPTFQRMVTWMNTTLPDNAMLAIGPTKEFDGLLFFATRHVSRVMPSYTSNARAYLAALRNCGVTHLVIHQENIAGWDGTLRATLATHWSIDPDGSVSERSPVAGWERVYADPGSPRRFLVYRPKGTARMHDPERG